MHKASDTQQEPVPLASCILSLQGLGLKRRNGKRERESRIKQTRWRKRLGRVGNKQLTVPLTVAVSGRGSPPLSPLSPPYQTTSARGCSSGRRHCTRQPCPWGLGRAALTGRTAWGLLPFPGGDTSRCAHVWLHSHNHRHTHTWSGGRTKQTRSQVSPLGAARPGPAVPSAGPSVPQLRCSALCRRGRSGTDLISWGFRCSTSYPSAFPPQK